ncbi:MAG: biopolymer transporter ExbD [Deltaproteobacteria bacterium]|nr:biopolymer transporter ExbD [Deltaproteobacteria bacterium]
MAGGSNDTDDVITGINITPLVDIMLCLLVIFMVTTSVVVNESIKMDLPEASTGEGTEPTTIMVSYAIEPSTGVRKLFLNGASSDTSALREHIRAMPAEKRKDAQAVIAADKNVSHGEVIMLIDLVKQEGVLKFALNIETVTTPAAAQP